MPTPPSMLRLRSFATVMAVVGLVGVIALGVLGAVLRAGPADSADKAGSTDSAGPAPTRAGAASPATTTAAALIPAPRTSVGAHWRRVVGPQGGSYAVPRSWRTRPRGERVSYREDGRVTVEGVALSQSWANDCQADFAPVPVAWALLGAPVASTNADGFARAAAAGWARGYAAMGPDVAVPKLTVRPVALAAGEQAVAASVVVDLGDSANPCAGDTADVTVVALSDGDQVRSLVVARYLGVGGSPSDATYAAVLASLRP